MKRTLSARREWNARAGQLTWYVGYVDTDIRRGGGVMNAIELLEWRLEGAKERLRVESAIVEAGKQKLENIKREIVDFQNALWKLKEIH